jgi:hypothetical protein
LARWNFRTAIGTDHNIALSGGTDNVVTELLLIC